MSISIERILPILTNIADQLRRIKIPFIQGGTEHFITAGTKTITFPQPFKEAPTLWVFIEAEKGWYLEDFFPYERLDLSAVKDTLYEEIDKVESIPELSIDIPTIPKPELEVDFANAFSKFGVDFWDKVEEYIFKDLIAIPAIAIEKLDPVWRYLGASLARTIEDDLWDAKIQPQLDKIENELEPAVNNVLRMFREKVNDAISKIKKALKNAVDKAVTGIETGMNVVTDQAGKAWNLSIDKFYEMTGLETGIIVTPAAVQNRTATKFEIKSPGPSTIHWGALGQPYITGPVITELELFIKEIEGEA